MKVSLRSFIAFASFATATAVVQAQSTPPIVALSAPTAKSTDHFGTILNVRQLADGKLLVNDGQRRQLSILDAQLGHRIVAIDSVAASGQSYGGTAAPIIPYLADSTLFVDRQSLSLLVIDPLGNVVRVMAAPKPADLRLLNNHLSGVDAKGNLIYQGGRYVQRNQATSANKQVGTSYDSMALVRANADTRRVDTIATVGVATGMRVRYDISNGKAITTTTSSPISTVDDWAVLSDGTVIVIRGHDYHVEWVAPNGEVGAGKKLPFDWKRLSDNDKQELLDSAKAARAKKAAERKPLSAERPPSYNLPGGGFATMVSLQASNGAAVSYALVEEDVPLSEIPDYWPPIRLSAAKADLDNNVWILPTTSAQSKNGELVYDVVNNRGEMTERVRVPAGRSIAGFGKNGVVYLMYRDDNGWVIEKTNVVREKLR